MFLIWLQFCLAASLIVFLGWRLSICGDTIAEKTGLGHVWVGGLLLAVATSLPETMTSLSAVVRERAPDLAMGNILGSIFFNLFIIAIIDLVEGKGPVLRRVSSSLILSAGVSILLILLVIFGLAGGFKIEFFSVSLDTLVLGLCVITGMRLVFKFDSRPLPQPVSGRLEKKEKRQVLKYTHISLKRTLVTYFILAGLVFICGLKLTHLADEIAVNTFLGRTFMGTLFLAVATSLPELAVSVAAVHAGLFDMAVSNIFGSNIYNVFIIFLADICYRQGAFFSGLSDPLNHMGTAVLAALSSIIIIIGLVYRSKKSYLWLGWDSVLITAIYIFGIWNIFMNRF